MKKLFVIAFIGLLTISLNVNGQHVFNKGDLMFNAGIGVPNGGYGLIPTLNFSGEYGVIPTGNVGLISFGGLAEFHLAHYSYYYGSSYNETWPRFYFGARAAWHLHAFDSDVFDVYGGVGLGIQINGKTKYGYYDNGGAYISPDIFVGGRWMFKPGIGVFAEVGYTGLSSLKAGITFGIGKK